jgi:SAM-dependent methyltransferase
MTQARHAVLPDQTHDENAREEYVGALRKLFTETLWPGARDVYEQLARPAFTRTKGRPPADVREVRQALEPSFFHRGANLIGRCAQEMLWDTVGESVERQIDRLNGAAASVERPVGSVRLNPELEPPRYLDSVDIHAMPGNFHTELGPDDVFAAALYDRGVYHFAYGGMGPDNDFLGRAMSEWFAGNFPDARPKRILDLGCGPGFSTLPWKKLYPEAEVHGLDISAPMVRYAHARAESMGVAVHFSQQDAAATDFPDESFDLVTSCLLTHENPVPQTRKMFAESHRLLRPGGIFLIDGAHPPADDHEDEFFTTWFNYNANEPFAVGLRKLDLQEAFTEAGFPRDSYFTSGARAAVYLKGMAGKAKRKSASAGYRGAIKA